MESLWPLAPLLSRYIRPQTLIEPDPKSLLSLGF